MFLKITLILLIVSLILFVLVGLLVNSLSLGKRVNINLGLDTYPTYIWIFFLLLVLTSISTIVFLIITIIKW